ncbi:MAG TPA: YgeY family selenium metabolism-linked hydrolase [Tepidisphaeraceae bacterium]|jgi:putative selenium metabolism hydrolase|nr:YgeY family selenium metabolism-linked hydrolase [Tepidisphaeraceae bacterium]
MDPAAILAAAKKYEAEMVRFLRDIIAIEGYSGGERKVIERIKKEVKKVGGADKVWVDGLGNLLVRVGTGPRVIAMDAHIDTVGVGNPGEWKHDPFTGNVAGGKVWGRGAGDQRGAVPAMVYAIKIIKELGLKSDEWSLLLTFTVMEEDCDGLCWQYIVKEDGIRPECVVITDSTNCKVLRGQRGRMEIGVRTLGKSCHGSMPEKGDNAVYKIAKVISEIEKLNKRLKKDKFLGKGTVVVSYVDCKTPSMCAVPGEAYIQLDRRLTIGETKASALAEVRDAVKRAGVEGKVELLNYEGKAYTGKVYETEKYFPTWVESADAPQVKAMVAAHEELFGKKPAVGRWTFSTNGVAIAGMFGIPCVGFGPAEEEVAHTVNDSVPIEHLVRCAAMYAAFPGVYCGMKLAGKSQGK